MSVPENWQNERWSDINPWIKIERRANLEKKSKRPALATPSYAIYGLCSLFSIDFNQYKRLEPKLPHNSEVLKYLREQGLLTPSFEHHNILKG